MLRHEFQPGKLVAGLILTGAAVVFGGDAAGLWSVPWFVMVPIVVGGLNLAGAMGTIAYGLRRRGGRGSRRSGLHALGARGPAPDGPRAEGPDTREPLSR